MGESPLHLKLKEIAILLLEDMGYKDIRIEYRMSVGGKFYRVDVAGFNDREENVAVECYQTSLRKFQSLKKVFSKVILLTPLTALEFYEERMKEQRKIIKKYCGEVSFAVKMQSKIQQRTILEDFPSSDLLKYRRLILGVSTQNLETAKRDYDIRKYGREVDEFE